jgi:hypothetical protein
MAQGCDGGRRSHRHRDSGTAQVQLIEDRITSPFGKAGICCGWGISEGDSLAASVAFRSALPRFLLAAVFGWLRFERSRAFENQGSAVTKRNFARIIGIDRHTGVTLSVFGVITPAMLMFLTTRMDWRTFFTMKTPALPTNAV